MRNLARACAGKSTRQVQREQQQAKRAAAGPRARPCFGPAWRSGDTARVRAVRAHRAAHHRKDGSGKLARWDEAFHKHRNSDPSSHTVREDRCGEFLRLCNEPRQEIVPRGGRERGVTFRSQAWCGHRRLPKKACC